MNYFIAYDEKEKEIIIEEIKLRSAMENNLIAKEINSIKAIEAERQRRIEHELRTKNAKDIIEKILEYINKVAEQGETHIIINWSKDNPSCNYPKTLTFGCLYRSYVLDELTQIVEAFGYKVYDYEYGKSWQTRSGKHSYTNINWGINNGVC